MKLLQAVFYRPDGSQVLVDVWMREDIAVTDIDSMTLAERDSAYGSWGPPVEGSIQP